MSDYTEYSWQLVTFLAKKYDCHAIEVEHKKSKVIKFSFSKRRYREIKRYSPLGTFENSCHNKPCNPRIDSIIGYIIYYQGIIWEQLHTVQIFLAYRIVIAKSSHARLPWGFPQLIRKYLECMTLVWKMPCSETIVRLRGASRWWYIFGSKHNCFPISLNGT